MKGTQSMEQLIQMMRGVKAFSNCADKTLRNIAGDSEIVTLTQVRHYFEMQ